VSRLLGPAPRAAMAALVDAVDAVNPQLLDELERAVAAHRRSKRGA
jgi:BlaI family transcriptional regulator, penicillinase repressor